MDVAIIVGYQSIQFGTANYARRIRRSSDLTQQVLDIVSWCQSKGGRNIRICGEGIQELIEAIKTNHPSIEIMRINRARALIRALKTEQPVQTIGNFQRSVVYGLIDFQAYDPTLTINCWQVGSSFEKKSPFSERARIISLDAPEIRLAALLSLTHLCHAAIVAPETAIGPWKETHSFAARLFTVPRLGFFEPPDLIPTVLQM